MEIMITMNITSIPRSKNYKYYNRQHSHRAKMYLSSASQTCTGKIFIDYFNGNRDNYKLNYSGPSVTPEAVDEGETIIALRMLGVRDKIIADVLDISNVRVRSAMLQYRNSHSIEVRRMSKKALYRKSIQDLLFKRKPRNLG